jgi:hypothetical protein
MKEHKYSLTQVLLENLKSAEHAYKEGHKICWKKANVLQNQQDNTYKKYKESNHISLIDHLISQPILGIFPIWTPISAAEVKKLQLHPV